MSSYTEKAELKVTEDGVYAYLKQDIEQGYKGESILIQVSALVNGKVWKEDK